MGQNQASESLPDVVEGISGEIARQANSLTRVATISYEEFVTVLCHLNTFIQGIPPTWVYSLYHFMELVEDNHTTPPECILLQGAYMMGNCMIAKILEIKCRTLVDSNGCQLFFAVQNGTDKSFLWKITIRILCVRVNTESRKIQGCKMITLGQFLRFAHTLQEQSIAAAQSSQQTPSDIFSTSALLHDIENNLGGNLEECCICLERKPDIILPCAHSFCLPCIEQWNTIHKNCPICREHLPSTDDSWVISEAPASEEITQEMEKSFMNMSS